MKSYQNLLFDLDGTLIDPKEGITNSFKYALSYFNIKVQKTQDLYKFIGPPLIDTFSKYYEFNKEDTEIAIAKYREYFTKEGIFENKLYKGIPEMLESLSNKTIILATSKPELFAKQILEDLKLSKYFKFICGSTLDYTRSNKKDIIQYILDENDLSIENTIMIGDREYDIIGAKETRIDSIGVLYGYGSLEELEKAGATYVAQNVEELKNILI